MGQFRTQTTPAPGRVLQQLQEQIDELYRALSSRGLLGFGGGGFGGSGGGVSATRIQHGHGTTDGTGKLTITFNPAFPSTPDVFAIAGGSGADYFECEVVLVSATTLVIIVVGPPNSGSSSATTGNDSPNHTHAPGSFAITVPAGAIPVTSTAAQPTIPVTGISAGESVNHQHPFTQIPQPLARGAGITVYWFAML